ncbi:uncharacterized protein IWZ02DRAFT_46450 [Phyllosticta citriasiana]|uniref:uncharacterized protein n=1 Tax=Phyllosticta citriasiana TaxID=595635 RepID=UPI0030FD746A
MSGVGHGIPFFFLVFFFFSFEKRTRFRTMFEYVLFCFSSGDDCRNLVPEWAAVSVSARSGREEAQHHSTHLLKRNSCLMLMHCICICIACAAASGSRIVSSLPFFAAELKGEYRCLHQWHTHAPGTCALRRRPGWTDTSGRFAPPSTSWLVLLVIVSGWHRQGGRCFVCAFQLLVCLSDCSSCCYSA